MGAAAARRAARGWDQLVAELAADGIRTTTYKNPVLPSGVSGWPLSRSDVGGYTSVNAVVKDYRRTPGVLARWAEVAAFGVVMRTHEGNRPGVTVQVADTAVTRTRFARMARLFATLAPHREELVREARTTGVPAVRHPGLVVPRTARPRPTSSSSSARRCSSHPFSTRAPCRSRSRCPRAGGGTSSPAPLSTATAASRWPLR